MEEQHSPSSFSDIASLLEDLPNGTAIMEVVEGPKLLDVAKEHCNFFRLFQPHPLRDKLHPNALAALLATPTYNEVHYTPGSTRIFNHLHIYTDASLNTKDEDWSDAWSFSIVEETSSGGLLYLGAMAGLLVNSGDFATRLPQVSSTTVELSGLLWAILWCLATRAETHLRQVTFHTDSATSIDLIGLQAQSVAHVELQMVVAVAYKLLELSTRAQITHVQAHKGDPWNELVDSLSKLAAQSLCPLTVAPMALLAALKDSPQLRWEPLILSPQLTGQYPLFDGNLFYITANGTQASYRKKEQDPTEHVVQIHLGCLSHNVKSLRALPDVDEALSLPGADSSVVLAEQYRAAGTIFVFLQEARRKEFAKTLHGYHMISGGCAGHQQGCEIWADLHTPYFTDDKGREHKLAEDHLRVIYKSPRILVVLVRAPHLRARLISAYAPPADHSYEDKEAFWEALEKQTGGEEDLFIGIDANSWHDLVLDPQAKPTAHTDVKASARLFADFLSRTELASPSLEGPHQEKLRDTCKLPTQHCHTIDYVLCRKWAVPQVTDAEVKRDIHTLHTAEDHWPVFVQFFFASAAGGAKPFWRRPRINIKLVSDPARVSQLKQGLKSIQPPQWLSGIDAHEEHLGQAIFRVATSAFGTTTRIQHKAHLSPFTWELHCLRRDARTTLRTLNPFWPLLLLHYS